MKKTLIAVLIVLSLLLAAAVGVVVYLESKPGEAPEGSTPGTSESTPADTQQTPASEGSDSQETEPQETTEETVGISLPTEDPNEVGPEYTWPEEEDGTQETSATADPDATWDSDENETPTMGV